MCTLSEHLRGLRRLRGAAPGRAPVGIAALTAQADPTGEAIVVRPNAAGRLDAMNRIAFP